MYSGRTAREIAEEKGFRDPKVGGFASRNGPIYRKTTGGHVSAFLVEERHCNPHGICHGGWLSTFADVLLAREMHIGNIDRDAYVTVHLSVDFVGAARVGDWVEGTAEVVKRTKHLVYLQGIAFTGERPVIRTNAIFQRLEPR